MLLILNLAIGLSFVFLLFSLVVTALNELILSFFDQRARFLEQGIKELLGQNPEAIKKFFAHGLIDSYSRAADGTPSYIPADAFVSVVLDEVSKFVVDPSAPRQVRDIETFAKALAGPALDANPKLKQSLLALFDRAGGDLAAFKREIAGWFDGSMERVTGWYKRFAQQVLFALALATAIACNVNSLRIIQGLTADPDLQDSMVEAATGFIKKKTEAEASGPKEKTQPAVVAVPAPNASPAGSVTPATVAEVKTQTSSEPPPKTSEQLKALTKQLQDSLSQLNAVSLPIGWGDDQYNYYFKDPDHGGGFFEAPDRGWNWGHLLTALFGWLITALAASLGAPFWFETLQRFVNIRGNGRSPAEAQKAAIRRVAAAAEAVAPVVEAATPEVVTGGPTVIAANRPLPPN
ncbi:MAG TPA: hypothetical protein VNP98_01795 [Chthoniobacterales bacterium]|nr:hypothetical protein [Chthoniobacterales bacterium]